MLFLVNMKMIFSSLLSLTAVSFVIAAQNHPCNQVKLDNLKKQIDVNSTTTMLSVMSFFDQTLAHTLAANDFFEGSHLSPFSNWPLLNIKCYKHWKRTELILSSVYSSHLDVIPMFMTIRNVRSLIKIAVLQGDIFEKNSDLQLSVRRYDVRGVWMVNDVSIGVKIRKGNDGTMYVSGSPNTPTMQIKPFVESLAGKDVIPLSIDSIPFLGSNVDFSLKDSEISGVYSKSRGYAITLYGRPSFKGPHSIRILLQHDSHSQTPVVALTAGYSSVSLSNLVYQLSGINISTVSVIGSLVPEHTKVMIASDDVANVLIPQDDGNLEQVFGGRLLKGTSIGTSFSSIDSQNSSEQYVIRLSEHTATFTSSSVEVPMQDLLKSLKPSFDVSLLLLPRGVPDVFTHVANSFFYDDEKSAIGATVKLDVSYQSAFDINWLSLNFDKGVVSLSNKQGMDAANFNLDANIRIGTVRGQELIGHGSLAIASSNSLYSAHFSSISQASVQDIMNAFGLTVSLPVSLSRASFPHGLSLMFSVMQKTAIKTIVPPVGLTLRGTMKIIGYELPASITNIYPNNGFNIDLAMVPISLDNGLFQFYQAQHETLKGPRFYYKIKQSSHAMQIRMHGHAFLLGKISQRATLQISATQYTMDVSTTIFHHHTNLRFYASYGPLPSTTFQVYSELLASAIASITAKVVALITAAAKTATTADTLAKSRTHDLSVAQARFYHLNKQLNFHVRDSTRLKMVYVKAVADLTNAQHEQREACSNLSDRCRSTCRPCKTWTCCSRTEPSHPGCVKCLRMHSCCPDPKCANACTIAKEATKYQQHATNMAREQLEKSNSMVESTTSSVEAQNATLHALKDAVRQAEASISRSGLAAADMLTRMGDNQLIVIRKILFDVPIAMAATGKVTGTVEASILRNQYHTFVTDIDLESVDVMVNGLAEKIFPGITATGQ